MTSENSTPQTESLDQKNKRLIKYFIAAIVGMFLFGFASIPLYRLVCGKLRPGGSTYYTGGIDNYGDTQVDTSREIRVRFATNVERQLPWSFSAADNYATVNPGEQRIAEFHAKNLSSMPSIGKAVYDINPPQAAPYFKKIECFCFTNQELKAQEAMDMPLVFWFDPDIPDNIDQVTIAYTFFNSAPSRLRAAREK